MQQPVLFLAVVLLLSAGCIGSTAFNGYFASFSGILERNGAMGSLGVPGEMNQVNGLLVELFALQNWLSKQPLSPDRAAISQLVEAELNLASMQQHFLLGQEQARLANLAFPSCEPESKLGKAVVHLETAQAQSILAEQNFKSFQADYSFFARQTKIGFDSLSLNLAASKQSIAQNKQNIQNFCP